jgi:hypothetical protein
MARKGQAELGPLLSRQQTGVTWYLDPADAPGPGLYVAVDFRSTYGNADQHSEYLVWYRSHEETSFKLMRDEAKFTLKAALPEAIAEQAPVEESAPVPEAAPIEETAQEPAPPAADAEPVAEAAPTESEPSTVTVSAPLPVAAVESAPAAQPKPIPFATVAEARTILTARTDVKLSKQSSGWLLVSDPVDGAVWSFPPPGHSAYPSVVKRFVQMQGGQSSVQTALLCQAPKKACDKLLRDYQPKH